jgi:hypothetical protein
MGLNGDKSLKWVVSGDISWLQMTADFSSIVSGV